MDIILLSHERELSKKSNTGRLVRDCLGSRIKVVVWKRKEPDPFILKMLEGKKAALLYPSLHDSDSPPLTKYNVVNFDAFIIIDATWQQAKKIYNHSEYLQCAPKISIANNKPSGFKRRRNQIKGGLCTAECSIELLLSNEEYFLADQLNNRFIAFNEDYLVS